METQPSSTTDGRSTPPTPPPAYSEPEKAPFSQQEQAAEQNSAYLPKGPSVLVYHQMQHNGTAMTAPQVVEPPNYHGPHDFLIVAVMITILCALANIVTLSFGIPSIVMAALSMNANNKKNYPKAKKFASLAFLMVIINILFTLCVGLLVIFTVLRRVCADPVFNYYALSCLSSLSYS